MRDDTTWTLDADEMRALVAYHVGRADILLSEADRALAVPDVGPEIQSNLRIEARAHRMRASDINEVVDELDRRGRHQRAA